MPSSRSSPFGWEDLLVVPVIVVLSVLPLIWFGQHWTINANDTARYLLAGSRLVSGDVLDDLDSISEFNGGHGPVLPAMVGFLILVFGRETETLVWALRLMALLNPLLAYLLTKRISTPVAGLIAAALVSLLSYNVGSTVAINIDVVQLTYYLLSLLTLLEAIKRGGSPLALLSGVLLGFAILTKETTIVNLPLALLAVLLLDWELRSMIWHYLGVALVCLPWWIWVYLVTEEVYLVGTLPDGLRIPCLIAAAVLLILAAVAYASGMVDRFLAEQRRRRWSGRLLILLWTIALSGLLLSTASYALSHVAFADVKLYFSRLLAPVIIVMPALLTVVGYAAWMAFREKGEWTIMSLALFFQVPVLLLLAVQRWAARQFLVPQTLVFCILAALVVAAAAAAWRGQGRSYRIAGAVVAAALSIGLLVSSTQTVLAFLPVSPARGLAVQHGLAPQASQLVDWMAENMPEGERILIVRQAAINVPQANYLMYLDGGRHEWTTLQLDQGMCLPRPNIQTECDPDQNAVSRIPPDALWVQSISGSCRVISLSASNLMQQSRRSGADYLVTPSDHVFPAIMELPPALRASRATTLAYARIVEIYGMRHGVVLQRLTGQEPDTAPARMNAITAYGLKRCEQAQGPGYEDRIDSTFPNGILVSNTTSGRATP